MKKGIVHMLEAILVSLVFLMIIPFLLYPVLIKTDWNYVQMSLNGQDLLATLDKFPDANGESFLQNIMNRNTSSLKSAITEKFTWLKRKRMNYGIESLGTIKNEIRVGFNCTSGAGGGCYNDDEEDEREYLEKMLRPAYINGRYVYFRVFPFSYDQIDSISMRSRYKMDVLLIRGENQRDDANGRVDEIKNNILAGGVGIVGYYYIQNLPPPQSRLELEVFGLKMGAAPGGTEYMTFVNSDNVSRPNYGIQKYFYAIGVNENFTYKFSDHNETYVTLWEADYWIRRNDTNSDGDYDALDIDTNKDGNYDELGKPEGYVIEMNNTDTDILYNFTIEKIDPDGRFFILNFNRETSYVFENIGNRPLRPDKDNELEYVVLQSGNNKAAVIVNGTDNSIWRAVWITDESYGNDINALVKSSIMWASERKWWNILRIVSEEHTKISYFVSQGEEFHEPYWVELVLWYVY